MTLCAATNRITSGSVALTAVSMYESLGSGGLFAVYAVVGFVSLPFYYTAITETAGLTLEEIAAGNNNPPTINEESVEMESGSSVGSTDGGKYSDTAAASSEDEASPPQVV
jgi:hypothetical protein